MPTFQTGTVETIVESQDAIQFLLVRVGVESRRAVLYTRYAAPASIGDQVVLNTTANELALGSGGDDFVVWNLAVDSYESLGGGHIMKLRYTPLQSDVLAIEAPESPHHIALSRASTIDEMPVVAASLHSQLLPVVVGIRHARPDARIAYVMTDGGALELALSQTVKRLCELGWLDCVISIGHAMGGALEAVNVYSGLLAARHAGECDIAVVGMGPGVVGTATPFGTTALELGQTLNAAGSLEGRPVAAVRMSSADERERHTGMSHHSRTALTRVALVKADVPVPTGYADDLDEIRTLHNVIEVDAGAVVDQLADLGASHMGRTPEEDRLFFLAAGAAGLHAASLLA